MPDFYGDMDPNGYSNAFDGADMQNIMQLKNMQAMNKKGVDQPSGMFNSAQMVQALRQAGTNPQYQQQYDPSMVNF